MLALLPALMFLGCFCVAAAASQSTTPARPISMRKRSSLRNKGILDCDAARTHLESIKSKHSSALDTYNRNTGTSHPLAKRSSRRKRSAANVHLTDDKSQLWYGKIAVGGQTFTVDFDTGSSDLILPGSNCSDNCAGHTLYRADSQNAAATGKGFSLSYGDGSTATGQVYTDAVELGGLKAFPQALGVATSYSDGLKPSEFTPDGLLGLAWPEIAVVTATSPVLLTLQKQGLASGDFAFKLSGSDPTFSFNTSPPNSTQHQATVPVTRQGFWQVDLDSVNVQGKGVTSRHSAIIDTGSTFILGDPASVQTIYSAIPGSKNASNLAAGFYTFPCQAAPQISLTFGGTLFDISKTFNIGLASEGSSDCVGGIAASDDRNVNAWVIGDVFLTSLDMVQFSFSKSSVTFISGA